jgi:hypothetical protein
MTEKIYLNNKEIIKVNADLTIDGLLMDGWVVWWMGHWVVWGRGWKWWTMWLRRQRKGLNCWKRSAFMALDIEGETSLEVSGGSAGFEVPSIFWLFPSFWFLTQRKTCGRDWTSGPSFLFFPCIPPPPDTQHSASASPSYSWSTSKQLALKQALWIEIVLISWSH